jgi:hypothetical protein
METQSHCGGSYMDRIFVYTCRCPIVIYYVVLTLIHFPAVYTPAWTTARVVSYYVYMRYICRQAYPRTTPRPRTTYLP